MQTTRLVIGSAILSVRAALVVLLTASVACGGQSNQMTQTVGPGLVVLHGATNVRTTKQNSGSVLYDLNASYPATEVIQELNTLLTAAGWSPQEFDVLDPKVRNSFDRGWTEYSDSSGNAGNTREKLQWNGQWKDRDGNATVYVLRFDATVGPGGHVNPTGPLHVSATRLSAAQIKRKGSDK